MMINRKDVELYAVVFKTGERAGWIIEELKQGEGTLEVRLFRSSGGPPFGWWRGTVEEFKRFCMLTTPPNAG